MSARKFIKVLTKQDKATLADRNVWKLYVATRSELRALGVPPADAGLLTKRYHPAISAALLGNDIPPHHQWPTSEQIWRDYWNGTAEQEAADRLAIERPDIIEAQKARGTLTKARVNKSVLEDPANDAIEKMGDKGRPPAYEEFEKDRFSNFKGNLPESIQWVSDHLVVANTQPEDAPSAQAFSLLMWARKNRSEFFKSMVPRIIPSKEEQERRNKEKVNDSLPLVNALLDEARELFGGE